MKSILIWHQGALGDFILSLPAIYSLKVHHRNEYLHLIARTDVAEIIAENRLADEVSSNEKLLYADFFAKGALSKPALEFLGKFSVAYVFARKTDRELMNNLRRAVEECFVINTMPPEGETTHVSAFQLGQLTCFGIAGSDMPALGVGSLNGKCAERTVITVHPGSGGRRKCWPLSRFLELIKSLDTEKKFVFYVILGPAEDDEMYEKVSSFISANRIGAHIIRGEPVSRIAGLLKLSSLHVGNDSGITHLSTAVGTPTVALFGPTDPAIWGPPGRNVRIVSSGGSCHRRDTAACEICRDIRCLETLEVSEVLSHVKEMMAATFRDNEVRQGCSS